MAFDVEYIRSQFPILKSEVYGRQLVYLDSGATAQKPLCVIEREAELYRTLNANIHRGVHHLSDRMTALYEDARSAVAHYIGAQQREVVFTSGATASINLVARSWAGANLAAGDVVLASTMEHHSNIVPWQIVAQHRGATLLQIPILDNGAIDMEQYAKLLDTECVKMVAITQASNTLGTRPDLKTMTAMAHKSGALVLVDGCQGIVHERVDVKALDCDFYAFSGHKLYAPTGIGVLYGKGEILDAMPPFMGGGDMVDKVSFEHTTYAPVPLKFEAGTANFIGAVALAEAIAFITSLPEGELLAHEQALLRYATEQLLEIEGLTIYGTTEDKAPIVSFNVAGCDHYDIGMILDKMGVAVRTGHHCAQPTMERFGVNGMCRASFGLYNTTAEIDALVQGVRRAVRMLR